MTAEESCVGLIIAGLARRRRLRQNGEGRRGRGVCSGVKVSRACDVDALRSLVNVGRGDDACIGERAAIAFSSARGAARPDWAI